MINPSELKDMRVVVIARRRRPPRSGSHAIATLLPEGLHRNEIDRLPSGETNPSGTQAGLRLRVRRRDFAETN